ncbi:MAG: hypothetical protein K0Q91_306 [Fibrobacteria bacterium]|nr:hypothetical protein [Fibrobacteria bacterium]
MRFFTCVIVLLGSLWALPARAEFHAQAGGGLHVPNGDSARFFEKGYRLELGVEYKFGNNLGLLVTGAYNRDKVDGDRINEENPSIPAAATVTGHAEIYELNLLPKFYLLDSENLGAYFIGGGGPRWFERKVTITPPVGAPTPARTLEKSERSLALQGGFGVEAILPGSLRIGINPMYTIAFAQHRVEYATLTIYLKL